MAATLLSCSKIKMFIGVCKRALIDAPKAGGKSFTRAHEEDKDFETQWGQQKLNKLGYVKIS